MTEMQTGEEWFASGISRSGGASRFVERVRALAPAALGRWTQPASPAEFALAGDLLVVDIPGVIEQPGICTLQVMWRGQTLEGYWTDGYYLWDAPLGDAEVLNATRVIGAVDAAERAVGWLAEQLARPLDHEVWVRGAATVGERWAFADTGRTLYERGNRRARRLPSSSSTRVRPTPSEADGDRQHVSDLLD